MTCSFCSWRYSIVSSQPHSFTNNELIRYVHSKIHYSHFPHLLLIIYYHLPLNNTRFGDEKLVRRIKLEVLLFLLLLLLLIAPVSAPPRQGISSVGIIESESSSSTPFLGEVRSGCTTSCPRWISCLLQNQLSVNHRERNSRCCWCYCCCSGRYSRHSPESEIEDRHHYRRMLTTRTKMIGVYLGIYLWTCCWIWYIIH